MLYFSYESYDYPLQRFNNILNLYRSKSYEDNKSKDYIVYYEDYDGQNIEKYNDN